MRIRAIVAWLFAAVMVAINVVSAVVPNVYHDI